MNRAASRKLAQAAILDYKENPQLMREAVLNGNMRSLIKADVDSAMRDIPTPSIFPNLRAAASQIIANGGLSGMGEDEAVGSNDIWAQEQGYASPETGAPVYNYDQLFASPSPASTLKQSPAPTKQAPAQAASGNDWTSMISSVIKSAADAGSAIFKAQTASQTATKQASLISKLFGGSSTGAAGTAQAGMLGGSMLPILLIGGAGLVGVVLLTKSNSGGTSRRSSTKRRRR